MPGASAVRIPLRAHDGRVLAYALVDSEDLGLIGKERHGDARWHLHSCGYAARRSKGKLVFLHRVVMGLDHGDGLMVDHINRDIRPVWSLPWGCFKGPVPVLSRVWR